MKEYSALVLQHFAAPQFVGELPPAPNVLVTEVFAGGKKVKCFVAVADNCIIDFRYQVYGCPAMIACMSWMASELIGKTVIEAQKMTAAEITEILELPVHKQHCAVLAETVLKKIFIL